MPNTPRSSRRPGAKKPEVILGGFGAYATPGYTPPKPPALRKPAPVAPTGKPTPPAAPAAPALTPYSPGVQGQLDQESSGIAADLKSTVAGITQAEDRGANDYGFAVKYKPDVGPNGERTVESFSVDPANPFSRAALLQRSYDNAKRTTTNSYAASGQLYAGSMQNAQNENARGFQQGDNSLRQAFADFVLGNETRRTDAVAAAGRSTTTAAGQALDRQMATTPVDPGKPVDVAAVKAAAAAAMKARVKARLLAEAQARKRARG